MIEPYVGFLRDRYRIDAFRKAIAEVVRPGDVVIDVGSGLGTFAFFAARAGARKVYAIERGPTADLLRTLVRENGFETRIEVIKGDVQQVALDSRADLLLTEDFDDLFLTSDLEELLIRPGARLLKTAGRCIPFRTRVCFAPVACVRESRELDPWLDAGFGWGLHWTPVREMELSTVHSARLPSSCMLSPAQIFAEQEMAQMKVQNVDRSLSFPIQRQGMLTALAGWFEADLSPSVTLSNAPGTRSRVWGQGLLLVPPTVVRKGDRLSVRLALLRDRWGHSFWRWQGQVMRGRREHASFDRSTFGSAHASLTRLDAWKNGNRLPRSEQLAADHYTLGLLKRGLTPTQVGRRLRQRFPARFRTSADALRHAVDVAEEYV